MKKIWAYILPTALCFVLGGLAGWLQQDAIEEWYPLLDKPTLTPPNAVFPIAWKQHLSLHGYLGRAGTDLRSPRP